MTILHIFIKKRLIELYSVTDYLLVTNIKTL